MTTEKQFDQKKFDDLVLFLANQSRSDQDFGAVKLNKLLYYSDIWAYQRLGESITGATYTHQEEGPVPKEFLAARARLTRSFKARLDKRSHHGYTQDSLVALGRWGMGKLLSDQERGIATEVVREFSSYSGSRISEYSHRELPWRVTKKDEVIPYGLTMLSDDPLTLEEEAFAAELAAELGLS